jgi:UDP-N-acetylglucosamine--N-acetylmuramyl-(pentapeptide) pyrophosphoryl-undecaprenol N-acetylglucosamine transferase
MNVVIAGGGTAGHVEPALALADALTRRDASTRVTLLGTPRGLETRLVPARGYQLDTVDPVPLPRRVTPDLLKVPFRLRRATRQARAVLRERGADVVVGVGGYAALPAYLAARRRVPVVVHEANATAGLANRVGARFAAAVVTTYPGTALPRAVRLGIPLRAALADHDRAALRPVAVRELGLDPRRPTLLVFGGSQGARRINQALLGIAGEVDAAGVQVLHATGPTQHDEVVAGLAAAGLTGMVPPYVAHAYLDRMDLAYAAADLVLCRAGAMTVAELTAVGLPAVYVPLPIGNGEQRRNAAAVVAAGGGIDVADADLSPELLRTVVLPLLQDRERLDRMSAAAAAEGRPDAADQLAELVTRVALGGRP